MTAPLRIGRYLVFESFARGGMAGVHFGRVLGPVGFSRVVAVKRHYPHLLKQQEFASAVIDEGRLAGRIRHPNVVPVIDVVQLPDELLLVMDYVAGVSLANLWHRLAEKGERMPVEVALAIMIGVLHGLHAAHEAKTDRGEPLGIVHRDVSPQNVLVGSDGVVRVTDFGIAHAVERLGFTATHEIKGKLEYMSKEQLRRERVDRRTDVYAAGVVLWESLTGSRLFANDDEKSLIRRVTSGDFPAPSTLVPGVSSELDAIVLRALAPEPAQRFSSAREMAVELQRTGAVASQHELEEWVERVAGVELERRRQRVADIEAYRGDAPRASEETLVGSELVAEKPDAHTSVLPPEELAPITASAVVATRPLPVAPLVEPSPITETRAHAIRSVPPPKDKRGDKLLFALPVAAFVLGSILLVSVAVTRARGRRADAVSPSVAALPLASPFAAPEPSPSTEGAPLEPASAPPQVAPAPSASEARDAAPTLRPPRVKIPRPVKTSKPGCNPPYTIDSQGVRVPKPECFSN